MKRAWWVFGAALALYLPAARYGFVQDDYAIIHGNPAAHGIGAALRAFDDPYWPAPARAGLYRPVTILSYAFDWTIAGGRPGWLHAVNALLHAVACVLVVGLLKRWLSEPAAIVAGLMFAVHPVHVEGVANLVARAELLAAVFVVGAVLLARRRRWVASVACAGLAMLSKEHAVICGVVILLDDWLQSKTPELKRYPAGFYVALGAVTLAFFGVWWAVGSSAASDVAPPLIGASAGRRLAVALPAVWRAAALLAWPADLVADYNPQVLPVRAGISIAALAGTLVVVAIPTLAWWARRRAPALAIVCALGALAYLPTSNLLFASGVVLAERNLYFAVLLPAVGAAYAFEWLRSRFDARRAAAVVGFGLLVLALRSSVRLPVWRDSRTFLLTTLVEHPESYRAHRWAAGVLVQAGDTAGALLEFARADSIFPGDPSLHGAYALLLLERGDTTGVAELAARARRLAPRQLLAVRAEFLMEMARGDRVRARALADSAIVWYPWERGWYMHYLQ